MIVKRQTQRILCKTTSAAGQVLPERLPLPSVSPTECTPVSPARPSKKPKTKQNVVFDLIAERLQAKKDSKIDKFDLQVKAWAEELKELPCDTSTEVIRLINDIFFIKPKKGK